MSHYCALLLRIQQSTMVIVGWWRPVTSAGIGVIGHTMLPSMTWYIVLLHLYSSQVEIAGEIDPLYVLPQVTSKAKHRIFYY
ncbi:predicted protein [Lichtheimia corymbifera JMRC:FSU:9682]|uniref:Uncharacterized protein n=1 Tax=Lichtheimia corymbifera JMRC:FSU:9682 TaxID=1263082 RepID=A0A068S2N2_9FUNG|nr:predicted protein [Lichtheimia corymbifera JMRC:FSU:9682]